jgi:hypothetical protein
MGRHKLTINQLRRRYVTCNLSPYRFLSFLFILFFPIPHISTSASAVEIQLVISEDKATGYNRNLFKHWIDADKDGCNTRGEVLVEEAIVKPKIGLKCKLTGGKWLSAYDGKTVTNSSLLDVDHMVPLAEAWRSGAWKWTPAQRQAFANDLDNLEALIAVTLSTNRSKGDRDPTLWMPIKDKCTYTDNWISIKTKYSLTVDSKESATLISLLSECGLQAAQTPTPIPVPSESPLQTSTATPSSSPVKTEAKAVTPGAFCTPAGAIGKSASGVEYTCKTSATDTRNRWRL